MKIKEIIRDNLANILFLSLDIIIIIILLVVFYNYKTSKREEDNTAMSPINESFLADSYGITLRGSVQTSGDKMFVFGDNNEYSGYFSEEKPNVKDYYYSLEMSADGSVVYLHIYNADQSDTIWYILTLNEETYKFEISLKDNPLEKIIFD